MSCEFDFEMELYHLEKETLLELLNPKHQELQNTYVDLKDLQINDHDPKSELQVYVILAISDYTKIIIQERPRVGLLGETIAEFNKLWWVIVSPGQETGVTNMLFSITSIHDYEKLWSLDYLGIKERHDNSNYVSAEFQIQLERGPGGLYEIYSRSPFKNNKSKSLGRLSILVKKITRRN